MVFLRKLYFAFAVVCFCATANAAIPEGYTKASYTDSSKAIKMEYGVYEPESDDPTTEFALFVLSGLSEKQAADFLSTITYLSIPACVYCVPEVNTSMVNTSIRSMRIDPDRLYLVSNGQSTEIEGFAGQILYNPSADINLTKPAVIIHTSGVRPENTTKEGKTITFYSSLDSNSREELLSKMLVDAPDNLTIIVEDATENMPFFPEVINYIITR